MIWIALALLSIAAMLPLGIAIDGASRAPRRREASLALHRAQLAELEQSVGRDESGAAEQADALVDVQRRLVASADECDVEFKTGTKAPLLVALCVVPALALALYFTNGSPNLPSVTSGAVVAKPTLSPVAERNLLMELRANASSLPMNGAEARSAYIALGKAEAEKGDMPAAAAAWNTALSIAFDPTLAAATGEALSEGAGHVDAHARVLFQRALAGAAADAPWRAMVTRRLAEANTGNDAADGSASDKD